MQKVSLLCVGKLKERFFAQAAEEYAKRLQRFCRLEICELPEARLPDNPSPAQIDAALAREAELIRAKLPPAACVVALCVEGSLCSSEALAQKIAGWATAGDSHLVFVIGGSLGLSEAVLRRADLLWSFSDLTFPHQLMRMMLLEQIYRGYRILQGEPYHK